MASTQGSDASRASLLNRYAKLCADMPKSFTRRVDGPVRDMLKRLDLYRQASIVLFYVPIHEEFDTLGLIEEALEEGKRVAVPYLNNKTSKMQWYEIDSVTQIRKGPRGIAAPLAGKEPLGTRDFLGSVCLVPGLVFDGEGYRVGYGAGYYDEFLMFYPGHKVGLVRSVQVSSNPLPHDEHDVAVDVVVTEGSIWNCRRIEG